VPATSSRSYKQPKHQQVTWVASPEAFILFGNLTKAAFSTMMYFQPVIHTRVCTSFILKMLLGAVTHSSVVLAGGVVYRFYSQPMTCIVRCVRGAVQVPIDSAGGGRKCSVNYI
jgi:hypothetical protein